MQLYFISSGTLKAANKQYSNLNNEYELTFRDSTELMACNEESSSIPTIQFDFVSISDLAHAAKESVVDIMGVCKSFADAATITSSKTQKELVKRDIILVDKSGTDVSLTLWGSKAETFDGANHPVICVKGAKVSDYNGVSLSTLSSSVLQVRHRGEGKLFLQFKHVFDVRCRSTPTCPRPTL